MAAEPFKTTDEEFQGVMPDWDLSDFEASWNRLYDVTHEQFKRLNEMKDGSDKKSESPTQLARKELTKKYEDVAEEVLWENIDGIVNEVMSNPESGNSFAAALREWADFMEFMGELYVQNLRNQKYAGSTETDDDAVAQRELVSRLIATTKHYAEIGEQLFSLEGLQEKEVPNMQGNKVGLSSTGVRKSSAYPVVELNMEFTVDGEELPAKTGLSTAVIDYLFPTLGKYAYGLDIEHSVMEALKKENENWTKEGQTTTLYFAAGEPAEDGQIPTVEFTVEIVKVHK